MTTPSITVQAAQQLLAEREAVGLAKRGTTVDRTDLQAGDWLQHAIENACDLLLYLIRLQQTMSGAPAITPPTAFADIAMAAADMAIAAISAGAQPSPAEDPEHVAHVDGWMQAEADAERAAYLSRWKNAPECAEWRSEHADGSVFWLNYTPTDIRPEWKCEPRPTPSIDPERAARAERWANAPEWAMWINQCGDGSCYWSEHHPENDWSGRTATKARRLRSRIR